MDIPISAMTPLQMLEQGLRLHKAGHLAEAESLYGQLLARDPKDPDALHYRGLPAAARATDVRFRGRPE